MLRKMITAIFVFLCFTAPIEASEKLSDKNCETVREYYPKLAAEVRDFLKTKLPTHPKYKQHFYSYLRDLDKWQAAFRICFEKQPVVKSKS